MAALHRRRRPLDPGELRQVTHQTPMTVVKFEDDIESYAQKWPHSPLAESHRHRIHQAQHGDRNPAASAASDDDPFAVRRDDEAVELVIPAGTGRSITGGSNKKLVQPVMGPMFTCDTSPAWTALGKKHGSDSVVHQVLQLERRLHDLVQNRPHSAQMLTALEKAFPLDPTESRLDSTHQTGSTGGGAQGKKVHQDVYNLYLECRKSRRSPSRPWGMPLVSSYLVCNTEDDYFLPIHLPLEANPAGGAAAASGSKKVAGSAFGRSLFRDSCAAMPLTGMLETRTQRRGVRSGVNSAQTEGAPDYLSFGYTSALQGLMDQETLLLEGGGAGATQGRKVPGALTNRGTGSVAPRQWAAAFPVFVDPVKPNQPTSIQVVSALVPTQSVGSKKGARKAKPPMKEVTESVPTARGLHWQRGTWEENDLSAVSLGDLDSKILEWQTLWAQQEEPQS